MVRFSLWRNSAMGDQWIEIEDRGFHKMGIIHTFFFLSLSIKCRQWYGTTQIFILLLGCQHATNAAPDASRWWFPCLVSDGIVILCSSLSLCNYCFIPSKKSEAKLSKPQSDFVAVLCLIARHLILRHWKSQHPPSHSLWIRDILVFSKLKEIQHLERGSVPKFVAAVPSAYKGLWLTTSRHFVRLLYIYSVAYDWELPHITALVCALMYIHETPHHPTPIHLFIYLFIIMIIMIIIIIYFVFSLLLFVCICYCRSC